MDIPWENFVIQYDFKFNPNGQQTSIENAFRFSNQERIQVWISYDDGGFNVNKTDDSTGTLIHQYVINRKINLQRASWYTLQFIFFDQFLAIYLNNQPIFFQENMDLSGSPYLFISVNTKQSMDMEIDNFMKWNLEYATGIDLQ
jgi:hypothetical protein